MPLDPCNITPRRDADLLLVGGGLANGLIAWRLKQDRPALRVLLIEAGDTLGGNHTWSFHPTDLDPAQRQWLQPLVTHRWPAHEVIFPQRRRRLAGGYASITSERFNAVLSTALGERAWTGAHVAAVSAAEVQLADGRVLRARAVIDGRGVRQTPHLNLGYQKFLGQEVRLRSPHGLDAPVLMDATVAQTSGQAQGGSSARSDGLAATTANAQPGDHASDGYRFVYVLPLSADTLLIEDTFYADDSSVDADRLRRNIADYALSRGWDIAHVLREEHGVLPIVLSGDVEAFWDAAGGVPQSGLAAGLFHPTTGYSLPDAVTLADLITSLPDLSAAPLFEAIRRHAVARWKQRGFFRLLNRMLFRSAEPALRWKVMQRFYGLPEPLIARFYAANPSPLDKLRIVTGKPPVPLLAAMRAALDLPTSLRPDPR
ncbi:hypothetical protein BH09PSE5_BH09PSE5_22990 [soil metagenome]